MRDMRPRKHKGLEINLHSYQKGGVTYYRYWHPMDKRHIPFGIDRKKANLAAKRLNNTLLSGADLVNRVLGDPDLTFNDALALFESDYPKWERWAIRTKNEQKFRLAKYRRDIGHKSIAHFSLKDLGEYLEKNFSGNGLIKNRNLFIDLYTFFVAKGYVDNNLAQKTLAPVSGKRQRDRLTLEEFKQINEIAPVWLKNAMDLSFVTLQARSEIVNMKFMDIKGGWLYVIRNKTKERTDKAYIRIKVDGGLEKIINRCRTSGMVSPYIIHRRPEREQKTKTLQVNASYLSKQFAFYRDKVLKNSSATFHEIRSLGGRELERQGFTKDTIKRLYGHTSTKMTNKYLDDDQIKWVDCEAPLQVNW